MEDTIMESTDYDKKPSLLEKIRQNHVVISFPATEEDYRTKMKLIIEHRLEFPSKLRPAIQKAIFQDTPQLFILDLYNEVMKFFVTEAIQIRPAIGEDPLMAIFMWYTSKCCPGAQQIFERFYSGREAEWHGLDDSVDTEEEAEVVIRLFPIILGMSISREDVCWFGRHYNNLGTIYLTPTIDAISVLLSCTRSISFLPLFLKLRLEFRRCSFMSTFMTKNDEKLWMQLLFNRNLVSPMSDNGQQETFLAMLVNLMRSGLVSKEEFGSNGMMNIFLRIGKDVKSEAFKRRLEILIKWNPYLLLNFKKGSGTLLYDFCHINGASIAIKHYSNTKSANEIFSELSLIVELGIYYYPEQLGFIFHNSNFQIFCDQLGNKRMVHLIHEKLERVLRQRHDQTLAALAFSVAQNRYINEPFPDALYAIIRHDPMEALMLNDRSPQTDRTLSGLLATT